MQRPIHRRDFLASGLVSVGVALVGVHPWRRALAALRVTAGPYGALTPPDANGLSLPEGFTSRVVARSGRRVAGDHVWHAMPDGGACFPSGEDGWIYVSNSEVGGGEGGVGALVFDPDGTVVDAYAIATGTSRNCSGGPTPWGTWLSCEETDNGLVIECDPSGPGDGVPRPALGRFTHEAAAVDPDGEAVYLTEDTPDGRFYRFLARDYPSLGAGTLQVADVAPDGAVTWRDVPDPSGERTPTRRQVTRSTRFDGGEGTWFGDGKVYFTTKGDDRVWSYDTRSERLSLLHDPSTTSSTPLRGVDNITGSGAGELFVAEDGGNLEIVVLTPDGEVAPLLRLSGDAHRGSELAGPALSPDGSRLYFSSQRGYGTGVTFEVTGPFRKATIERPDVDAVPTPTDDGGTLPLLTDEDGSSYIAPAAAGAVGAAAIAGLIARRRSRSRSQRAGAPPDA